MISRERKNLTLTSQQPVQGMARGERPMWDNRSEGTAREKRPHEPTLEEMLRSVAAQGAVENKSRSA